MLKSNFPHNYKIIVNPELPGTGDWNLPEIFVPQDFKPSVTGSHLIVKVEVDGMRYIWHVDASVDSEIWSTPDPDRILIDTKDGFLFISPKNPHDITSFGSFSTYIKKVEGKSILLVAD